MLDTEQTTQELPEIRLVCTNKIASMRPYFCRVAMETFHQGETAQMRKNWHIEYTFPDSERHLMFTAHTLTSGIGIAGLGHLSGSLTTKELFNVAIEEKHRGKGYLRPMISAIEDFARNSGVTKLGLEAPKPYLIEIYEKMGFRQGRYKVSERHYTQMIKDIA